MRTQIKSYAIIVAIVLFVILFGAFGIYYKMASSQIDTLTAANSTLSLTVALNEKTIDQMKLDAQQCTNPNPPYNTTVEYKRKLGERKMTADFYLDEGRGIQSLIGPNC